MDNSLNNPEHARPEVAIAVRAVRAGAQLVKQIRDEVIETSITKTDLSPVTLADLSSQAVISRLLLDAAPSDPLVGEEDASHLRSQENQPLLEQVVEYVGRFLPGARPDQVCEWIDRGQARPGGRYWTVDPIDGTKGYLRGGEYAVAVALVENGQVQVGALGCPNLIDGYMPDPYGTGSILVAVRGNGAWNTSLAAPGEYARLRVSQRTRPSEARWLRSFESKHTNVKLHAQIEELLDLRQEPVLMDSQAKYAIIASGKAELFFRLAPETVPVYREKLWDHAAGSLLVEEAGGKVTDIDGRPLDFTAGRELLRNQGILVTNGLLHEPVVEALHTLLTG